jgi:hypothetical protein
LRKLDLALKNIELAHWDGALAASRMGDFRLQIVGLRLQLLQVLRRFLLSGFERIKPW